MQKYKNTKKNDKSDKQCVLELLSKQKGINKHTCTLTKYVFVFCKENGRGEVGRSSKRRKEGERWRGREGEEKKGRGGEGEREREGEINK